VADREEAEEPMNVVATAIAAVILGAFDSLWSWLSGKIY